MAEVIDTMQEYHFHHLLNKQGKAISEDIQRDLEGQEIDTGFECYTYIHPIEGLVGYIYMGDCGEWAFRYDKENDQVENAGWLLEWAKSQSPYKGW